MATDPIKAYSIQQSQQPNNPTDPQLDQVMQSLLIDDPDIKRILKGEIHECINRFNQMIVYFQQHSELQLEFYTAAKQTENAARLIQIDSQLKEIHTQLGTIEEQLKKYRRYVPYLLLFTPTSVLSNITEKEAKSLWRKIDIMITRDELDCQDDDDILEDKNFFDAIRIALYLHMMRNVEGHTFRGLIEERRKVETVIDDRTNKSRKKIMGIF